MPLPDLIALSALFHAHALPPIASDAPACAFLARACLSADTPHARAIAATSWWGHAMYRCATTFVTSDARLTKPSDMGGDEGSATGLVSEAG